MINENRFEQLAEKWKRDCRSLLSSSFVSYLQLGSTHAIISMGKNVTPRLAKRHRSFDNKIGICYGVLPSLIKIGAEGYLKKHKYGIIQKKDITECLNNEGWGNSYQDCQCQLIRKN